MDSSKTAGGVDRQDVAYWNTVLAKYKEPSWRRASWQIFSTLALFVGIWALMDHAAKEHYGVTLLLALPAAALLMRLFMIQHDCGHGSFFPRGKANDALGAALGVITLTPYTYWLKTHSIHHATSGNLDRRGWGDIDTLT